MRRWGLRIVALISGAVLAASGIAAGGAAANAADIGTGDPVIVGNYASGMASTPDGRYLYVTVQSMGQVRVIDTALGQISASIAVGNWPRGIAMSADGARAYVVNSFDHSVSVIDTASNAVLTTVMLQMTSNAYPWSIAISPDGERLYVSGVQRGELGVIELDTLESRTLSLWPASYYGGGLAVSPDGSRVYIMSANGLPTPTLTVFDTVAETFTPFPLPDAPNRAMTSLAVSPDGERLYVTVGGEIRVLDTADDSMNVIQTIPVGSLSNLLLSADGTRLYVSRLSDGGGIDVYETATSTLMESIPLESPTELALSPDGGALWAVHGASLQLVTAFARPVSPSLVCELPSGVVGTAYAAGVTPAGSPMPAVTLASGELPPGLQLSADGSITGTPTESGTFSFSLSAGNDSGTVSCEVSVTVAPATGGPDQGGGPDPDDESGDPDAPETSELPAELSDTGAEAQTPLGLLAAGLLFAGLVVGGSALRLRPRRRAMP